MLITLSLMQQTKTCLPGNAKVLVRLLRREESVNVLLEGPLEIVLENNVLPVCLLDLSPESTAFAPVALIVYPNLIVKLILPSSRGQEEQPGYVLWAWRFEVLVSEGLGEEGCAGTNLRGG